MRSRNKCNPGIARYIREAVLTISEPLKTGCHFFWNRTRSAVSHNGRHPIVGTVQVYDVRLPPGPPAIDFVIGIVKTDKLRRTSDLGLPTSECNYHLVKIGTRIHKPGKYFPVCHFCDSHWAKVNHSIRVCIAKKLDFDCVKQVRKGTQALLNSTRSRKRERPGQIRPGGVGMAAVSDFHSD